MRGTGDGLRWGMGCEVGGECIAHCGRTSALRGGAEVLGKGVSLCGAREGLRRGMGCAVGGKCIAQPAGVRLGGEGVRKCSGRARRCAGAGADLRWGMCCEVGGCAFGLRGEWKCAGRACRCAGAGADLRRGMCCEVGGRASVREGSEKMLGKSVSLCGGGRRLLAENVLWSRRGLTHFRHSSTRARVLLYIRPPRHRREIAAMGPKDAPCEHPSPAKTSAFAASAFALPRPRSHFRARVHTSPAWPSAAPTKTSASRSSSYPQWVIHGKVIHIVSPHLVQNVLALAPAHAYI